MATEESASDDSIPLSIKDSLTIPRFVIGRGRRGGWIVNDRLGRVGGIFINQAAALHYASEESERHPELVIVVDGAALDLDFRKAG